MAKEIYLARYMHIISRLEKGPASFEQIRDYLEQASEIDGRDYSISIRTLQRDIRDIYSQLNIEITNDKKGDRCYRIVDRNETIGFGARMLESYQIIHAINTSYDFQDVVFLENRQPKGLEHFHSLLHAIRNKRVTEIIHQKYSDTESTTRIIHPLALKEALGRWYIIAIDTRDNKLKTFGLDRISDVFVQKTRYREKYDINLRDKYRESFGILTHDKLKIQQVILRFSYEQGQYVKTYPLHNSQRVIKEDKQYVLIELNIYVTYDFLKELLSFGHELQVIEPLSLKQDIQKIMQKALEQYKQK
ncbi:MAG: helix-turn-helix transcriptional regulator [Sphingobacteriales bacterium]|jgi:proteasome accessory factor B